MQLWLLSGINSCVCCNCSFLRTSEKLLQKVCMFQHPYGCARDMTTQRRHIYIIQPFRSSKLQTNWTSLIYQTKPRFPRDMVPVTDNTNPKVTCSNNMILCIVLTHQWHQLGTRILNRNHFHTQTYLIANLK